MAAIPSQKKKGRQIKGRHEGLKGKETEGEDGEEREGREEGEEGKEKGEEEERTPAHEPHSKGRRCP